jgi:hypothetical protein
MKVLIIISSLLAYNIDIFAAPIPKALLINARFPNILTASHKTLLEWAERSDNEWLTLVERIAPGEVDYDTRWTLTYKYRILSKLQTEAVRQDVKTKKK